MQAIVFAAGGESRHSEKRKELASLNVRSEQHAAGFHVRIQPLSFVGRKRGVGQRAGQHHHGRTHGCRYRIEGLVRNAQHFEIIFERSDFASILF